jgi:hypothetical protein
MRNQIHRYILGLTFVASVAAAVPATAAARDGRTPLDFLVRLKNAIIHILDTVEIKGSLPPG